MHFCVRVLSVTICDMLLQRYIALWARLSGTSLHYSIYIFYAYISYEWVLALGKGKEHSLDTYRKVGWLQMRNLH